MTLSAAEKMATHRLRTKAAKGEVLTELEIKKLFPVTYAKPFSPEEYSDFYTSVVERMKTSRVKRMQETATKMVEALYHGASIETARALSGTPNHTLNYWLKQGHIHPNSIYGVFLKVIQEATAKCDFNDLKSISQASNHGEWEASVARLKLRGFGSSTPTTQPIEVKIVNFKEGTAVQISNAKPQPLLDGPMNGDD